MKRLMIAALLMAMTWATNSYGGQIQASVEHKGAKTIVSCVPQNIEGDIVRALITLYKSDGNSITVTRDDMAVSADKATYRLPGSFLEIGGKCKFFISEKNVFSVDLEYPAASQVTVAKAAFYASRD